MMKKFLTGILIGIFLFCSTEGAFAGRVRDFSQLERREIETHFYDTADTDRVMRAAVNTLQDSGFVIQEIEPELGYLRAQKTFKKRYVNKARVAGNSLWFAVTAAYAVFSYGYGTYYMADPTRKISNELHEKTVVVDSNVNVEKFGKNKTKVRFVLVQKVLQNADGYSFVKSAPARVIRVYSPKVYREFFAQLDKSLFYEGI
ncbi:MAG: hypothetical protein NC191_08360 [Muribaculaceae bacterium]|nr:hypothetical protein [Muribaculaceae bacterium]